ncbi:glycosyltransferase family 2 protein [Candidatus Bathyarchaeota archaeon]|nr:MAG: glycosyltransferase family 2 protein [Candidatus Bathyarchaeota archaeon]
MSKLTVSVIICTYTEERLTDIREAIYSVRQQTYSPDEVLLVVDNNEHLYAELAAEFGGDLRVLISNKNTGVSAARNVGIRAAKGEIIAFLDDDTVAQPQWLERLIEHYQDETIIGVMGETLLTWANGKPPVWFPWEFDWILGGTAHKQLLTNGQEVYTISDPNMSFRREVLVSAGLWREGLGQQVRSGRNARGGDIAEICHRIRQAYPQGRFIYEPSAVVFHKLPAPRARLSYFLHCAFLEGETRASVDRVTRIRSMGRQMFPTHQAYLRNVLAKRLPARLSRFYRPVCILQLLVMLLILALMAGGYIRERVTQGKHLKRCQS